MQRDELANFPTTSSDKRMFILVIIKFPHTSPKLVHHLIPLRTGENFTNPLRNPTKSETIFG
jgi:hypothetical protein